MQYLLTFLSKSGQIRLAKSGPGTKRPVGVPLLDVTLEGAVRRKGKRSRFPSVLVGDAEIHPEQFSPMLIGPIKDYVHWGKHGTVQNLEIFWRWGTMYSSQCATDWFSFRDAGYAQAFDPLVDKPYSIRRPKKGRAFKTMFGGIYMKPVLARKLIYVPLYAELVTACPEFDKLARCLREKPQQLTLLDLDGPTKKVFGALENESLDVSIENLQRGINNPKSSFGHGYVLAGLLAGILPTDYVQLTVTEQDSYRNSVRGAEKAERAWRHPSFVYHASKDPEFVQWLTDSIQSDYYLPVM